MPKYKNYILYETATGNIRSLQNWPFEQVPDSYSTAEIGGQDANLVTQRYDASTGQIVDRDDRAEIENQRRLEDIRSQRNTRLIASDWTQLPDVDLTAEQRQAWADYRQQLRDIMDTVPATIDQNYVPTWPVQPS